jgi:hypothetical protein
VEETLDSDAARRVLRRAQDIAAAHGRDGGDAAEATSGVSPQALVDAAEEVGIDADAVRDALALERFDADSPEPQAFDRLSGPSAVSVEHVVDQSPSRSLEIAEDWLSVAHRMRCVRTPEGGLDCRPRPGLTASVGRTANGMSGEVNIEAVARLTVSVQALVTDATPERPRTLVRIVADRRTSRRRRLGVGAVAGATGAGAMAVGVAGAVVGSVATVVAPMFGVPLMIGGYATARSGRRHADKVELELMRVLSGVDRGERPVGLVGRAARRARRAVSSARTDT